MNNLVKKTRDKLSELVKGCPEVLQLFDQLGKDLQGLSEADKRKILEAVVFAAEKHRLQKRKGPEAFPYIIHPIGVAHHLLSVGRVQDRDVLIGALLHDTVEDTQTTFQEIKEKFGEQVENYVREMTDDKSLTKAKRKRVQIVSAPQKSAGATQIKLADKFFNLKDLNTSPPADWSQERIREYFQWAKQVVENLPKVNAPLKQSVDEVIYKFLSQ